MSSNSQAYVEAEPLVATGVRGSTSVSVAELLHDKGATRLSQLLERLPEIVAQLPAEQRAEFSWSPVDKRTWETSVEGHAVRLNLEGAIAELTVSGTQWVPQGAKASLPPLVMARAERRLNQLFALAVAQGISQQLGEYVTQRGGSKVTQKVQVKAVEVRNRVALRATTALKMRRA